MIRTALDLLKRNIKKEQEKGEKAMRTALWKVLKGGKEDKNIFGSFIFINILIWSAIAGIVWFAVGRIFLPQIVWLTGFLLYGAFTGFFSGILFYYREE